MALASLQLAAKMEEDAAPAPSLLLPLAGGVYDKADLARTELEMFQVSEKQMVLGAIGAQRANCNFGAHRHTDTLTGTVF